MILTTEEQQSNLVANAYHREMEIYHYQINIDNYTAMLNVLPSDAWPEALAGYQSIQISDLPLSMSDSDVQTISDYQYRDQIQKLLRTEKVEQAKSNKVLDALKSQIVGDYSSLIASYKATQA